MSKYILQEAINPLSNSLRITTVKTKFSKKFYKDSEGITLPAGEISLNLQEVDTERASKLYIRADFREYIGGLSNNAKILCLYIPYKLTPGVDYFYLDKEKYANEWGVKSINTIKKAIDELAIKAIIHESVCKNWYWINPSFFFCGNRIIKYPDKTI